MIIDGREVWTGSMNFTYNGAYHNDNALIITDSQKVAEDFEREFDEMYLEDRFGALSLADTPYPDVLIGSTAVEVMFSPDDGLPAA
jgi:phosphatidylserine/phosphatidylglycerophosphate/cardiolipin synthase-like enzyme